jgi:hypothetical protein
MEVLGTRTTAYRRGTLDRQPDASLHGVDGGIRKADNQILLIGFRDGGTFPLGDAKETEPPKQIRLAVG